MLLTRHHTQSGTRWAVDGHYLHRSFSLSMFLCLPQSAALKILHGLATETPVDGPVLAPLEASQEVWASGVTYLRSRVARQEESQTADVYEKVYSAERPELFFKSLGWRVIGDGGEIRIREDSSWNVPEPELTLVINSGGQILGYCAGNDVSSRSIEGANPLYLPQAKIYRGACALGPGIKLCRPAALRDMKIELQILRGKRVAFKGETRTSKMHRRLEDLVGYLYKELDFPEGAFLMTGTGIVPEDSFSLKPGDRVRISIGDLKIENRIASAR